MKAVLLDPVEAARELGVTVKTLRVYETRGLLMPGRSANGWRVYGPAHIARVHEILALKALGLTLKQIGDLLRGRSADLGRSLATHRAALHAQRQTIDRALLLVDAAEKQIGAGKSPTAADLAALAQSIARPEQSWGAELAAIYDRHIDPTCWRKLAEARIDWSGPIAELKKLHAAKADPASPAARSFVKRWVAASDAQTAGDRSLDARAHAAWSEALNNPKLAPRMPLNRAETDYLLKLCNEPSPKRKSQSLHGPHWRG